MTFGQARKSIGKRVSYKSYPNAPLEFGRITEVRRMLVFVQFDGEIWAKGCRPEDLVLL